MVVPNPPNNGATDNGRSLPKSTRAKRFQRRKEPPPIHLTARDFEVLQSLAQHRFLSGGQLQKLVFACSESRSRRRLRALFDHGLIERVSLAARPTSDLPSFVYALSASGAAALAETGEIVPHRRGLGCGFNTIRHRLCVTDFYVALHEAISRTDGLSLESWAHEEQLWLKQTNGTSGPERIVHPTLEKALPFLPDAYFQVRLVPGGTVAFFLEIDLASHPHRVWRERAKLYTAYADPQAGLFRRRFQRESFRLLIVTPADYRRRSRCQNVLATIRETVGPSDLFLATTLSQITSERLLAPVWLPPGGTSTVTFLDNPRSRVSVVRTKKTFRPAS